jgi:hypothetical protein
MDRREELELTFRAELRRRHMPLHQQARMRPGDWYRLLAVAALVAAATAFVFAGFSAAEGLPLVAGWFAALVVAAQAVGRRATDRALVTQAASRLADIAETDGRPAAEHIVAHTRHDHVELLRALRDADPAARGSVEA